MIGKIKHLFHQIVSIRKLNKRLADEIAESGSEEGMFFVKLKNGQCFYSNGSRKAQRFVYPLFSRKIKKLVSKECANVLFDIEFRYWGPDNKKDALSEGKLTAIKQGEIIFEIGAYIGFQAIKMSELVGEHGKIIAIEAVPDNFKILQKNISANQIKNIIPLNVAVWKEKGVLNFNLNEKQKNSAIDDIIALKSSTEIPCNSVDNIYKDLELKTIDTLRIQTNGAELEALEGMVDVLKLKPQLLVAVPYLNKEVIEEKLIKLNYHTTFTGHSIWAVAKKENKNN